MFFKSKKNKALIVPPERMRVHRDKMTMTYQMGFVDGIMWLTKNKDRLSDIEVDIKHNVGDRIVSLADSAVDVFVRVSGGDPDKWYCDQGGSAHIWSLELPSNTVIKRKHD